MAQFDVREATVEGALVVDCQCELLDDLGTRVVIPLYRADQAQWSFPRLTPVVQFGGEHFILATPDMATVAVLPVARSPTSGISSSMQSTSS